ncbi:metal ABC transporter permease [Actinomyces sp. B33]|uniref:metal ABC transporter permease n=1 Tax=Actinomyces sp. B33 TaxID=2942131 RepID=UPI002340C940|nr:metal ABC transporter permease [Actinomyces sp. B33]MDC4232773.1 metal ABC transporter permease [Actinomyces sp. B33]
MILEILTQTVYQRVIVGSALIGLSCGFLGCFTYLRRQSLVADVIGHSSMLGVSLAFLASVLLLGVDGRNMLVIVVMCGFVGVLATLATTWLPKGTRAGTDAAMAVVLALTFGGGMALLAEIRSRPFPSSKAGLEDYLFGNATTLTWQDIRINAVFAVVAILVVLVFWNDIALLVFDRDAARVLGRSVRLVEVLLVGATVVGIVIGLKSVGLVLVVAYVVLPSAAARQWVDSLGAMAALAGCFGLLSSVVGSVISVVAGKVPSGPTTVLVLTAIMLVSLFLSPKRSVLMRARRRHEARDRLLAGVASGAAGGKDAA